MELHSMLGGSLDGKGLWGRMDTFYIYVWVPSMFTWNYHIVNWLYIPIQNKKRFIYLFLSLNLFILIRG